MNGNSIKNVVIFLVFAAFVIAKIDKASKTDALLNRSDAAKSAMSRTDASDGKIKATIEREEKRLAALKSAPSNVTAANLVGVWTSSVDRDLSDLDPAVTGRMRVDSRCTYLSDGRYRSDDMIAYTFTLDARPVVLKVESSSTGTWRIDGPVLTVTETQCSSRAADAATARLIKATPEMQFLLEDDGPETVMVEVTEAKHDVVRFRHALLGDWEMRRTASR